METFWYRLTQVHLENGRYNIMMESSYCCLLAQINFDTPELDMLQCFSLHVICMYTYTVSASIFNDFGKLVPECRIILGFLQQEMTELAVLSNQNSETCQAFTSSCS